MSNRISKYGLSCNQPDFTEIEQSLFLEMEAIRRNGSWKDSREKQQGMGLPFHYKTASQLIWSHLDWHRWAEVGNNEIRRPNAKVTVLMGSGCVAGHTRILNPITGEQPTIRELHEKQIAPIVMTLYGKAQARIPFIKGVEQLYEILLSSGEKFEVTGKHLVLTLKGFSHVSDLSVGELVFSYSCPSERNRQVSNSGFSPSIHGQDAPDSQKIVEDFQDNYSVYPRLCGEQLLAAKEVALSSSPLSTDAPKCMGVVLGLDGLDNEPSHIHSYQLDAHLSSLDVSPYEHMEGKLLSLRSPEEISSHDGILSQSFYKSHSCCNPHSPFLTQVLDDAHTSKPCNYEHQKQRHHSYSIRVSQTRVLSITKTHKDTFYDISVPGVEHYFAEGAIHHNSTGKTNISGWEYLLEYYCRPNETLVLISSTDMRGLELRVWGEIKMLHDLAINKFSWLPGYLVDSKHCITTDELDDDDTEERIRARDLRKGIIGIPTVQGGRNVGLGKWQGIKQKHLRLVADDCTAMSSTFLSAFANLNNNVDFQAIICFNPDDILDPGGVSAEPKDGWSGHLEPTQTTVWDTKFFNGRCVNLVGLDSPNFDYPKDQPPRYPYLVSQKKIDETLSAFPKDSFEYYSQCVGVMKISQMSRRVITRDLCKQFHAMDGAIWDGTEQTLIAGLDASYGGDRCVGGHCEFGRCMDGKIRLQFHPYHIVPVKVSSGEPMAAEDTISEYEKKYCESNTVKPENFFHDSTGRGSLGTSLSRIWSSNCNPIEFGGSPTKRPVTMDTFINDKVTGERRLKRCDEHYSKFVTELWYSLRYAIEADQIRGLPQDVVDELSTREWDRVKNDKIEVESKVDLKLRIRKSCDLGDWAAICLEGARRRGFQISKLSNSEPDKADDGYFKEIQELDEAIFSEMLVHS
jgi:hypothetical protein